MTFKAPLGYIIIKVQEQLLISDFEICVIYPLMLHLIGCHFRREMHLVVARDKCFPNEQFDRRWKKELRI